MNIQASTKNFWLVNYIWEVYIRFFSRHLAEYDKTCGLMHHFFAKIQKTCVKFANISTHYCHGKEQTFWGIIEGKRTLFSNKSVSDLIQSKLISDNSNNIGMLESSHNVNYIFMMIPLTLRYNIKSNATIKSLQKSIYIYF